MTMTKTSRIKEMTDWVKRMHLFHPGRYFCIMGAIALAACSLLSLLIALPFILA